MQKLKVFKTTSFPPAVEAAFASAFDVTTARGPAPLGELCGSSCEPDVVLCSIDVRITDDVIKAMPASIRAIATYSVGLDHIDRTVADERGLTIFNTPGVLDGAVADAAMFLLLGAARRGVESIALLRSQTWRGWTPTQLVGLGLAGRKIGILGLGGIGSEIARRARGFGLEIAYSGPRPSNRAAGDMTYVADANALVAMSDIVVLACPSTPETRNFVNRQRLALAKADAIFVNIGRGDLVDDDALIEALESRRIFAAGLDVFAGEPHLDPRYFDLPNAFLTPHIGSSTREARMAMAQVLINDLLAWHKQRST